MDGLECWRHWGPVQSFQQESNLTRAYDNYSVHVYQNELGKGAAGERESVKRLSEQSRQEVIRAWLQSWKWKFKEGNL